MIKYENGKVYKIIGPIVDEPCYVGSTTRPYLSQRMSGHGSNYKAWKSGLRKHYISSFELFDKYGLENCTIVLLEICKTVSKDKLRMKEQEHINQLDCINKHRA